MDLHLPDSTEVGSERRRAMMLAGAFAGVALLAGLDLAGDLLEGSSALHACVEGAIVAVGGACLVALLRLHARLRRSEQAARHVASGLAQDLSRSRADAAHWRAEAAGLSAGLGTMIDAQLVHWQLSPAEKDVALLMLKGFSHKEIAAARGVSEATVRQQATACYRKAGVGGRHDLVAFFLEDLLAPRPPGPPSP